MKARITLSLVEDGAFDLSLNEAGRDLLIRELQGLSREWDHFHLDCFEDPEIGGATDVQLSGVPYRSNDLVLRHGKVQFRPDDWDRDHYPHVMAGCDGS